MIDPQTQNDHFADTSSTQPSRLQRIQHEWLALLKLGTPILIGQLAMISNGIIDTVMAGRAGANDLTGVAIGNSLWVPLYLFTIGILNASQPIISGHRGAGEHQKIMPTTWNTLYISFGAAAVAALLLFNVRPILDLIGQSDSSVDITVDYLKAFALGIPAILILTTLRSLTDGLGHTKIFMSFSILSALFNAPLNYIFIFGKFGAPELGGIGCGWATAIANLLTLFVFLFYLNTSKHFQKFHLWLHRSWPDKALIKELLKLGVPIGFTIFVESTMFSVVALLLASLGDAVVAGHQISLNVVSVLFMVPLSLGMALTLRISYLIGAKDSVTARLSARSSLLLVLLIALIYAAALFIFARPIASIYTTDEAVIGVAVTLLGFGAMFQIADVLQVVSISALRGYKDTKIPMYIMLSSFWGIGIPLGYVLAFKDWILEPMGAPGLWIGLIAGLSHAAFWLILRLFWKSK